MERNSPQHKVDAIRAGLSPEQLAEFDDFCKHNRNTTEIRRLLEDWGYKVSQSAVQNWYKATFPIGKEAKRFNLLANEYSGVDLSEALQKILILNANLIDRLIIALEEPVKEDFFLEDLVSMIPSLSREVRACASELQQIKYIKDRKELENAGAYRAMQELKLIFADSPFEKSLEEAIRAVLSKMDGE